MKNFNNLIDILLVELNEAVDLNDPSVTDPIVMKLWPDPADHLNPATGKPYAYSAFSKEMQQEIEDEVNLVGAHPSKAKDINAARAKRAEDKKNSTARNARLQQRDLSWKRREDARDIMMRKKYGDNREFEDLSTAEQQKIDDIIDLKTATPKKKAEILKRQADTKKAKREDGAWGKFKNYVSNAVEQPLGSKIHKTADWMGKASGSPTVN